MQLLDKSEYSKVADPLSKVTINTLFARSVVESKVTGKIYVDNINDPGTFYVVHPYCMTLLFGNSGNASFNAKFRNYALNIDKGKAGTEWMQAFPNKWDGVLQDLFDGVLIPSAVNAGGTDNGIVELNTRVNFKFNKEKYIRRRRDPVSADVMVFRTDRNMFREMRGSVVPMRFWDNEDDFFENGLAYSLLYKGELASMAFSSFWFGDQFELGIETIEKFRGRGLAELVCSALIDHCLDNSYEPIWSCRLENVGSYKLAQKLGFDPVVEIPYYRL